MGYGAKELDSKKMELVCDVSILVVVAVLTIDLVGTYVEVFNGA